MFDAIAGWFVAGLFVAGAWIVVDALVPRPAARPEIGGPGVRPRSVSPRSPA